MGTPYYYLTCYADLHGQLEYLDETVDLGMSREKVKAIVLAGDILPDCNDQKAWCESNLVPFLRDQTVPVVAVAGNHDHLFLDDPDYARSLPWVFLENEWQVVGGVTFWGGPHVDAESKPVRFVGSKAEVVVTHGPPFGCGDVIDHDGSRKWWRCGCRGYGRCLEIEKPALVVFGHCHSTSGFWRRGDTVLVNATSGANWSNRHNYHPKPNRSTTVLVSGGKVAQVNGDDLPDWLPEIPGRYLYDRVGIGKRNIYLEPDGNISEGAASCERQWRLKTRYGFLELIVSGDRADTMRLVRDESGRFVGRWLDFERNDVVLTKDTICIAS